MKKSLKKVSGFVAVLLVLGLVFAGCGAQKKDLTGKWTLDTISVYGIELKAADVVEADGALSEIGFSRSYLLIKIPLIRRFSS